MAFDRVICPTCLSDEFIVLTQPVQRLTDAQQDLSNQIESSCDNCAVRCKTCGLGIECQIRIPKDAYSNYHEIRDGGLSFGVATPVDRWHHDFSVAVDRIRQLSGVIPKLCSWIDVGCNVGAMLSAASRFGYLTYGVEVSQEVADIAKSITGRPVEILSKWMFSDSLTNGWTGGVVSMFDVIEHAVDPIALLRRASSIIRGNGGAIVIEVPDLDSIDQDSFLTWRHRRISNTFTEHIYHFSEKSLRHLVSRHLPFLSLVHVDHPVPGKLQVVLKELRKDCATATFEDVSI